MKVVYEAANLIDAHLVKHALEETGMPVFLLGEALLGAMGELPLFGVVAVCVPDSVWPAARAIVESLPIAMPLVPHDENVGQDDLGSLPQPA